MRCRRTSIPRLARWPLILSCGLENVPIRESSAIATYRPIQRRISFHRAASINPTCIERDGAPIVSRGGGEPFDETESRCCTRTIFERNGDDYRPSLSFWFLWKVYTSFREYLYLCFFLLLLLNINVTCLRGLKRSREIFHLEFHFYRTLSWAIVRLLWLVRWFSAYVSKISG